MKSSRDTFFTELWQENYQTLYTHASYQLYRRDMAGDVVAESFARCIKYMDLAHPKPEAWLMLTLNRLCLEINIKELRQQDLSSPPPLQTEIGIVELLPRDLRVDDAELLTLFYVEGRTLSEIAARFCITSTACKQRLYRARQRLKTLLEEGRQ